MSIVDLRVSINRCRGWVRTVLRGRGWSSGLLGTARHQQCTTQQNCQPSHRRWTLQILGNQDPHVHVHIVPRYDPDPAPSMPLPEEAWSASRRLGEVDLANQITTLREVLAAS